MQNTFKAALIISLMTGSLALSACENTPLSAKAEQPNWDNDRSATSDQPSLVVSDKTTPEVIRKDGYSDLAPIGSDFSTASDYSSTTASSYQAGSETLVGRKASELSSELNSLQSQIAGKSDELQSLRHKNDGLSSRYFNLVSSINAELQTGTTPGNPDLVQEWNTAQQALNRLAESSGAVDDLGRRIANDASEAAFLLESIRATFGLSGARKADHERLNVLEDDANQMIVHLDRLLNTVNDESNRRATFLRTERMNLQTLSHGIANGDLYGQNISNRLFKRAQDAAPGKAEPQALAPISGGIVQNRRPLVVIRFDRQDLDYEEALYTAVSQALESRPGVQFDLVAVSPDTGNPAELALYSTAARKNGEAVLRSLTQMGVPLERINLNAATSDTALNSEVHLYIR